MQSHDFFGCLAAMFPFVGPLARVGWHDDSRPQFLYDTYFQQKNQFGQELLHATTCCLAVSHIVTAATKDLHYYITVTLNPFQQNMYDCTPKRPLF